VHVSACGAPQVETPAAAVGRWGNSMGAAGAAAEAAGGLGTCPTLQEQDLTPGKKEEGEERVGVGVPFASRGVELTAAEALAGGRGAGAVR